MAPPPLLLKNTLMVLGLSYSRVLAQRPTGCCSASNMLKEHQYPPGNDRCSCRSVGTSLRPGWPSARRRPACRRRRRTPTRRTPGRTPPSSWWRHRWWGRSPPGLWGTRWRASDGCAPPSLSARATPSSRRASAPWWRRSLRCVTLLPGTKPWRRIESEDRNHRW